MKKTLLLAVAFLGLAMVPAPPKSEKLTLKERIDQSKEIKVYYSFMDITHQPNTNQTPGSQRKGTNCPAFKETTPLPPEYVEAAKQVTDLLNKGFNTTVFVEGDYSKVPLFESGFQKGSADWMKLGEPLAVWIFSSGNYTVDNVGLMNNVELENSLSLMSSLAFYGIIDGKVKTLENVNLVGEKSSSIKTKGCDDFAYFTKNFPLSSMLDKFKTGIVEKTNKFTSKEMAEYEKAMKKKI